MKTINHKIAIIISCTLLLIACEDEYLTEEPKSFLSPDVTYRTDAGLASGAGGLYDEFSYPYYNATRFIAFWAITNGATDFNIQGAAKRNDPIHQLTSEFNGATSDEDLIDTWAHWYRLANNATIVLDFSGEHTWENDDLRKRTEGEAHFFRAWGHFYLTMLWGDIPTVRASVEGVKVDFVRETQDEVLDFVIEDLTQAVELLPSLPDQPGRVVKGTAMHMLAYAYLSKKDYVNAERWAQTVIDDPNHSLVTERFGSRQGDPKGNVFWDLFQIDNHNNNPEALFVLQNGNAEAVPLYASWDGNTVLAISRCLGTRYERISELQNAIEYGGRHNGLNQPTMSWLELFESNDIRGQMPNAQTVWVANQQTADVNIGDTIYVYGDPSKSIYEQDEINLRPFPTKWNWEGEQALGLTFGTTTRDVYIIRLAETYLILAEAQLEQGKTDLAAQNINALRIRSGGTPIGPGEVTIAFILDEKARELWGEQYSRKADLFRTGKYVERVRFNNPDAGPNAQEKHTLLPIPQSEIDLNSGADLTQNTGY